MPTVSFEKMDLEDNINIIKWCYRDNDHLISVHENTINLFPELREMSDNFSDDNIDSFIEKTVAERYLKSASILDENVTMYQRTWNKYNDSFFKELCNYLNIEWPKEHELIPAKVGIIPVCPRYLDEFAFAIHDNISDNQLVETTAHELCHFLWFEKWKKMFPDYKREDFESPNIIWEYSEMVVDPILNSPNFVKIFGKNTRYAYDSFYEVNGLMEGLCEIYNSNISIEDKIVKGFEYFKNKKTIN